MTLLQRRAASSIYLERGPIACLMLHGFAGSPAEVRPLIDCLADHGISVSAPLLPGHGTSPEDLRETRSRHWVRAAEAELAALQERFGRVHVVGFSMGGLIALYLAAHHQVASVTTLAAPIELSDWRQILVPLAKYLIPYYESKIRNPEIAAQLDSNYERMPTSAIHSLLRLARRVRRDLPRVTAPVQALQGDLDKWIAPGSGAYILEKVASHEKRMELLPGRRHFVALERGRDEVCQKVIRWIEAHKG
ncbi:MAG: alpha/beta hydrolase [Bacillota bacterium]